MKKRSRQILSLDAGWRFHLGDIESPVPADSHIAAYMANKAGWARGAARSNFDDTDWRVLDLPHDWSVEGEFDQANYLDNGYLPRGIGWYRRHFVLGPADRGKSLILRFDGVASHCTVFVNGHLLHRNFCGYTTFEVDISDVARFGEDEPNVIAVRVDATPIEGWWYEGAGIYRHVHLVKTGRVRIETLGGTFVRPERHSGGEWETAIETALRNDSYEAVSCEVACALLDPAGRDIGVVRHDVSIEPRSASTITQNIPIRDPQLWSIESPTLYSIQTELRIGASIVDDDVVSFGYRTIHFDPDRGFFLNDRPLKLLGTCNHQDHAGVGVAVPDSIHEFRIRRLKEMGTNAYRCAHNPPAPELLDACDRLGMLVMDENRTFGSSPQVLEQLRSMVRRDRNHPSVILWSICNEESIQGTPVAANIGRAMQAEVKRLDPTRPVTAAVSGGLMNDDCLADAIEIVGINYSLSAHDAFHAKHPRTAIVAAETHSVVSTRGTYATDPAKFEIASYDEDVLAWSATARDTWKHSASRPYIAGLFIWTGFDYRGEPSPHGWPCVSSFFGHLDTCGFAKDSFWLHKAYFDPAGDAFVHVMPHWNWPGREGQAIRVQTYTNCDEVELMLNSQSLGRRKVDPIDMAEWSVPYAAGALEAIGYRNGERVAATKVETTGPAAALGLEIHPTFASTAETIPADGEFAIPMTVFATDEHGRRVPTAADQVAFSIEGEGRIIGVGNGDPTCHESDKGSSRSLFSGLAQVLVQTTATAGEIKLTATADGLRPTTLRMRSSQVTPRPSLPPARPRHFVSEWRMSPITPDRPDVSEQIATSDMNTWERIDPANGPQQAWRDRSGFAMYRATLKPPKTVQQHGGRLRFREIIGAAEVYFDGRLVGKKDKEDADSLEVEIERAKSSIALTALVQSDSTSPSGLSRGVEVVPSVPTPGTRGGG